MDRMRNGVQHYAWGSPTDIPARLGVAPDGRPWAELWMGVHPQCPSAVETSSGPRPLAEVAGELPYLVKILAAAEPLSLQAHPSRAQAEDGFAREEAAGIARDDPRRSYRDTNHKPELIVALTPFEALCGFAPVSQARRRLEAVAGPLLAPWPAFLRRDPGPAGLRLLIGQLLTLPPGQQAALVEEIDGRLDALGDVDAGMAELVERLALRYPGDVGVVVAVLLNRVVLRPDEALFLGPGVLHSYVRGSGLEVMATSDNVLRGGLTPKHVDVSELLRVLDPTPSPPAVLHAGPDGTYPSPAPEFAVRRLPGAGAAGGPDATAVTGPAMVIDAATARSWWVGPGTTTRVDAGWFVVWDARP